MLILNIGCGLSFLWCTVYIILYLFLSPTCVMYNFLFILLLTDIKKIIHSYKTPDNKFIFYTNSVIMHILFIIKTILYSYFVGSVWKWDCFLLEFPLKPSPCSILCTYYGHLTNPHVYFWIRVHDHCRSSCVRGN